MKRLIIDISSVLRALHFVGEDVDNGYIVEFEGKSHRVNSATHAYQNFMEQLRLTLNKFELLPRQVVAVLDGKGSRQLRQSIFPGYKAKRAARPPEINNEFNEAVEGVVDEIAALGGMAVWQDGMEADDVIAYLASNLEGEKIIWANDKDMLALVSESCSVWWKELNAWINPACPPEHVHVFKALTGDTSDCFPGAKGFGAGAFEKFVVQFGLEGLEMMKELIQKRRLHTLAEDVPTFKPLQKVIDSQVDVYLGYACACFYPERVNTPENPLQIRMQIGQATHEDYSMWHQTKRLATPADIPWIISQLKRSALVGLDIETSSTEAGDAWAQRILEVSSGRRKQVVDVFGAELSGMSLTFGENGQHTVYMPVDHKDCELWTSEQVMSVVAEIPEGAKVLIHNAAGFELPVLYNHWGCWIEGVWDTLDMASYVDENSPLGLKSLTKQYFGYDQTSYDEVTQGRKMRELSGAEVLGYACDDSIACYLLYNRLLFTMELEKALDAFKQCELESSYWVADAFVQGVEVDWDLLERLKRDDDVTYQKSWEIVKEYLASKGWDGIEYKPFEPGPAGIKAAFLQATGNALKTRVRLEEKLLAEVREQGCPELADVLENGGDVDEFLLQFHTGEPNFDPNKDAHVRGLMYETMKLPIRFRTRATENMRAKGQWEGTPQADFAAVEHALKLDLEEGSPEHACLLALREMKAVNTRNQLYYTPYPLWRHWKDGKLHPQLGKNGTATRRFAPHSININQMPKRKDGGKIRSIFIAPKGYLWASFDWSGQELRLAAERSGDVKLTACYMGEKKLNPHSLTASGIAARDGVDIGDYDKFIEAKKNGDPLASRYYDQGKSCNFSSQYLCRAPKLGKLLVVSQEEAQKFLDAKNEVFSGLAQWQQDTIRDCHRRGYAITLLGARRHLHDKLTSQDKWAVNEAERQGVNYEIQGSGAEMAKCSINAMHREDRLAGYNSRLVFPVHDEGDFLIAEEHAVDALLFIHSCMTQKYADMKIPLESELSIGFSFGTLKKVGEHLTREIIQEAVDKLLSERRQAA